MFPNCESKEDGIKFKTKQNFLNHVTAEHGVMLPANGDFLKSKKKNAAKAKLTKAKITIARNITKKARSCQTKSTIAACKMNNSHLLIQQSTCINENEKIEKLSHSFSNSSLVELNFDDEKEKETIEMSNQNENIIEIENDIEFIILD